MSRRKRKQSKRRYDQLQNLKAMDDEFTGQTKKTFSIQDIQSIKPRTQAQRDVFEHFFLDNNIMMTGSAGTGKTFIALYLALQEILEPDSPYSKVVIVRSTVPVREIGHLPGSVAEKISPYELPYKSICNELFPYKRSYDNLKNSDYVEFISSSHIQGTTLSNCIVVVDEAENMTFGELDSIMTRAGKNSKFIFCGDIKQSFLHKSSEKSGFTQFINILSKLKSFGIVDFKPEDIVRSGLVKAYILARENIMPQ